MTAIDIPGYVIRREVGVGGMASVYLALQTSLDREVALKVMAPALAADPTFSKRFLQEARMLASLAHPNIVQVYDVGVTQAQLNYFSMQYLSGGDFAQRVRLGMSEKDLLRILEGIGNALGYAHHRGYVHRDVAPGNILFDVSDTPLLTDFGIARAFSQTARITSAGISVGTSHYMSPEQARGSDVDARSDLYGLGVLTWFGLTGKPPYEGADGFAVSYAHVFGTHSALAGGQGALAALDRQGPGQGSRRALPECGGVHRGTRRHRTAWGCRHGASTGCANPGPATRNDGIGHSCQRGTDAHRRVAEYGGLGRSHGCQQGGRQFTTILAAIGIRRTRHPVDRLGWLRPACGPGK